MQAQDLKPGIVKEIPLDMIVRDPKQPRINFEKQALYDLAADIAVRGVRQPITVRPHPEDPEKLMIKMGERRYRASRIAKKETVPVLLDPTDETDSPLDRLLDQAKENALREDLNCFEWGEMFKVLRDEYNTPVHQISSLMKEHGFKGFGRSQVSNYIRLLDLPDWARAKINSGELTPAHGKYLLPAVASPKVLEDIERILNNWEEETYADVVTVSELEDQVVNAFAEFHPSLEGGYWVDHVHVTTLFDISTCKKCHNQRQVGGKRYCLSQECYDKKQSEVPEQDRKVGTKLVTVEQLDQATNSDGLVDMELGHDQFSYIVHASFDKKECVAGCPYYRKAVRYDYEDTYCFNLACYAQKEKAYKNGLSKQEKLGVLLDDWLREQLKEDIAGDEDLIWRLMAYMAIGRPEGDKLTWMKFGNDIDHERKESLVRAIGWLDLDYILNDRRAEHRPEGKEEEDPGYLIACQCIDVMESSRLRSLARRREININDYQIDEHYLAIQKGESLDELLDLTQPTEEALDKWKKLSGKAKRAELLEISKLLNLDTPTDIRELYQPGETVEKEQAPEPAELAAQMLNKIRNQEDEQLDWVDSDRVGQMITQLIKQYPDQDESFWDQVEMHLAALAETVPQETE